MKRKLAALLIASMVFACVGCAKEKTGESQTKAGTEQTEQAAAEKESTDALKASEKPTELVVCAGPGSPITSGNFDPLQGFLVQGFFMFHSSLLKYDADLVLQNDLAVGEHEISDDKLVYTFHIREDAKFSDGTDLTAEDVAFTFNKMKDAGTDVDVSNLDVAEALDDHTVRFTLTEPQSSFIDQLGLVGIVPKNEYDENYAATGIGSGPWKMLQCDVDQQTIVVPNEYYYGEKPHFTKVTFVNLDEQAALAALKAGELDVSDISCEYALEEIDGMHLVTLDTVDTRVITLPTVPRTTREDGTVIGNDVTCDPAIRKALNIGIDRQQIVEEAYNGFGKPGYGWATSWSSMEPFEDGQTEKAKQMLEEAGWVDSDGDGIREKDGIKAEFDVYAFSFQMERYYCALAMANQAKELGIQVNCYADSSDVIRKNRYSSGIVYGLGEYTVHQIKGWYYTGVMMNCADYSNPEVDAAIDAAINSTTQEEAMEYWKKAQNIAAEDVPYLFLVNMDHCLFVRDGLDLGTIIPNPHGHGAPIIGSMNEWKWEE